MIIDNPSTLLVVDDLALSKNFYLDTLGLELVEQHDDCIKFKAGHHELIMFQGSKTSAMYEHGYNANSTLLFTVSELDKKMNELKAKGVTFIHQKPNQNRWGRYAAFKDPSGIVHELFEVFEVKP